MHRRPEMTLIPKVPLMFLFPSNICARRPSCFILVYLSRHFNSLTAVQIPDHQHQQEMCGGGGGGGKAGWVTGWVVGVTQLTGKLSALQLRPALHRRPRPLLSTHSRPILHPLYSRLSPSSLPLNVIFLSLINALQSQSRHCW